MIFIVSDSWSRFKVKLKLYWKNSLSHIFKELRKMFFQFTSLFPLKIFLDNRKCIFLNKRIKLRWDGRCKWISHNYLRINNIIDIQLLNKENRIDLYYSDSLSFIICGMNKLLTRIDFGVKRFKAFRKKLIHDYKKGSRHDHTNPHALTL